MTQQLALIKHLQQTVTCFFCSVGSRWPFSYSELFGFFTCFSPLIWTDLYLFYWFVMITGCFPTVCLSYKTIFDPVSSLKTCSKCENLILHLRQHGKILNSLSFPIITIKKNSKSRTTDWHSPTRSLLVLTFQVVLKHYLYSPCL